MTTQDLESSTSAGYYGNRIVLAQVIQYTGSPVYQPIVSCNFGSEASVELVTVAIGEARAVVSNDTFSPGKDSNHLGSEPMQFAADWEWNEIKCVVEWERGLAKYSLECDPGCVFVLPATSVSISARTTVNTIERYLSASVTRGACPHVSPPKYTAGPNTLERVPASTAPSLAGINRFRIPQWARSFRVGTPYDFSTLCVLSERKVGASIYVPAAPPIWSTSWDELHPVPYGANNLYVYPCGTTGPVDAVVEFQLTL